MMVQSIAGLAAKAVNEGHGDELVWVDTRNPSLDEWLARWRKAHPSIAVTNAAPWQLIDGFTKRGLIKGYILASAVVLALAIGGTRIYLGVHYPTDVLAGWCAGIAWALLCSLIARRLQRAGAVERER